MLFHTEQRETGIEKETVRHKKRDREKNEPSCPSLTVMDRKVREREKE